MLKPASPHLMRQFCRAGLAVTAAALALAACGSSGGNRPTGSGTGQGNAGQTPGSAAYAGTITYTGTIYVNSMIETGRSAFHIGKSFTEQLKDVRSCAEAAKANGADIFQVPSGKAPVPEDDVLIRGFHGPGTYNPAQLSKDKSDAILVPGKSGMARYDISATGHGLKAGKELLFLDRNGDGQLAYSEAHLDGKASSPAVAGLINWTCSS
jgi:hypothetical protein